MQAPILATTLHTLRLADGTTLTVSIKEEVTHGCNFCTLLFNLGYNYRLWC